jgi:uncharacterized membrane protein
MKSIRNDLELLQKDGVIDEAVAHKILAYYSSKQTPGTNRLIIVFSILGSGLIGTGIILLLAHNWDMLPIYAKNIISFIPLLIGQALVAFSTFKKPKNKAFREGSAIFLLFGIGVAISLISQTYNLPSDFRSFFLTWSVLVLPIIYLAKSNVASMLYIGLISSIIISSSTEVSKHWYWPLAIGIIPAFYNQIKHNSNSNFTKVLYWLIAISGGIALTAFGHKSEELLMLAFFGYFSLLSIGGQTLVDQNEATEANGLSVVGKLGSLTILFILSFKWFWFGLYSENLNLLETGWFQNWLPVFVIYNMISILSLYRLIKLKKQNSQLQSILILSFTIIFILGFFYSWSMYLINILTLAIGVSYTLAGSRKNHLGTLNLGLAIITSLAICRFFDSDFSFLIRGLIFTIIGAGFFLANYSIIKKRQNATQ